METNWASVGGWVGGGKNTQILWFIWCVLECDGKALFTAVNQNAIVVRDYLFFFLLMVLVKSAENYG